MTVHFEAPRTMPTARHAEIDLGTLTECLVESAPVGQAVTAADGSILWANSAMRNLLGDAITGGFPSTTFPQYVQGSPEQSELREAGLRLLHGDDPASVEDYLWQVPDGPLMCLRIQSVLATSAAGEPILIGSPPQRCLVRQLIDVTATRAAEARLADAFRLLEKRNVELERSNEELSQFAYVASHDLSEPLRVIAGHVELLARRYAGQLDANADVYIDFAVDGCTRMRTLIDDLLRYSRAGRDVAIKSVDFHELLNRVRFELASPIAESHGDVAVIGRLPILEADGSQMSQLLTNLIANALKYSRADVHPKVQIAASPVADGWTFTVSDNGVGVPEEYRDRVFRIFQRLHGREVPGTGIGLAICRKIVEQHGGKIWVSGSDTGGASFNFTIPTTRDGQHE